MLDMTGNRDLTTAMKKCRKRNMTKQKRITKGSMTDLLRQEILDSPSFLGVERETGVIRQTLMDFARGKASMRLDKADVLAAYFGIECRIVRRKKGRS